MTKDKSLTDLSPEEKQDRMLELLLSLQGKVTKLEQESEAIQSLRAEITNPNPNPVGAAGGAAAIKVDEIEEKVMVDEDAMNMLESVYLSDMEMPVDDETGAPTRVFVEDHVDFKTAGFPMLIKRDMMMKRDPDITSHNPKVDKCKIFFRKQMDVRNTWELSEYKAREWESEFQRIPKRKKLLKLQTK